MKTTRNGLGLAIAALAVFVVISHSAAQADEFCVKNSIYVEGQTEPVSTSTTLFHEGNVYDFLGNMPEAVIYRPASQKFVLLDLRRGVRVELPLSTVTDFVEELRKKAMASSDPQIQFLADPKFGEAWDPIRCRLRLASATYSYEAGATIRTDKVTTREYITFADADAKLNTILQGGARPPFPRLALNAALLRRNATPNEINLTMRPKIAAPPTKLTSRHKWTMELTEEDLKRIRNAEYFATKFKAVDFADYQRSMQEPTR